MIIEITKVTYRVHGRSFSSRSAAEAYEREYARVENSEEYAAERRSFAAAWEIYGSELAGPKTIEDFMKVTDWGVK